MPPVKTHASSEMPPLVESPGPGSAVWKLVSADSSLKLGREIEIDFSGGDQI